MKDIDYAQLTKTKYAATKDVVAWIQRQIEDLEIDLMYSLTDSDSGTQSIRLVKGGELKAYQDTLKRINNEYYSQLSR